MSRCFRGSLAKNERKGGRGPAVLRTAIALAHASKTPNLIDPHEIERMPEMQTKWMMTSEAQPRLRLMARVPETDGVSSRGSRTSAVC